MKYLKFGSELYDSTRRVEQMYLRPYERFCGEQGISPWPADRATLPPFLESCTQRYTSKVLDSIVAAIRRRHLDEGWEDPFASSLMQSCARIARGHCAEAAVRHLQVQEWAQILDGIKPTQAGIRDKAMLLLVWCARASCRALSILKRSDIQFTTDGMRVNLSFPYGRYERISIAQSADPRYDPITAMQYYLDLLDDDEEVLFRGANPRGKTLSSRGMTRGCVLRILLRHLSLPGFSGRIGLRSLHASAIVAADNRGANDYRLMRQMGYARVTRIQFWKERLGTSKRSVVDKLRL